MIECTTGLDTVGFVCDIEKCFGISIPDDDAEEIGTVGDLYDYLRKTIPSRPAERCLTAHVFYRLRRSLMHLTGRPRTTIRPDTLLSELMPKPGRRQRWAALETHLGLELPRLIRPPVVRRTILLAVCVVLCVGLAAGFYGTLGDRRWLLVPWVAFPLAGIAAVLAVLLTRPLAIAFPGCATVGDLTRFVWAKNCASSGTSDSQIWEAIVSILSETVGMDPSLVTRELRFADIPGDL